MEPRVAELHYYPIKGCAGTSLERARLEPAGLVHDRSFVLVHASDGEFITQRTHPALATIRPAIGHDGAKLTVAAPGTTDLVLEMRTDGPRTPITVWSWHGDGVDQGEDAAHWFSEVLHMPVRLVRVQPEHSRAAPGQRPGTVGFADAYALLVASQSSLDELNARILARGAEPVPMNRFRPNIVVDGWPTPHTEDRAATLSIGGAEIEFAKVCERCAVPLVEQSTGRKAGPEPIRTLADYRRANGGVTFGANYVVSAPGALGLGDPVIAHSSVR